MSEKKEYKVNKANRFTAVFGRRKPVIGMLHLSENWQMSVLELARHETDIYIRNGVDAVLVENYFGTETDCRNVLEWLQTERPDVVYGVNILGDYEYSFELAGRYGAKFIQIDSVSGHLYPYEEQDFDERIARCRAACDVAVLGGVRFKYHMVASGRTLKEDLDIGMGRCDAIVVTGDATGAGTPMEKIREFRSIIGNFPLVVGAGVTAASIKETLDVCDGAIVGSYFKTNHMDVGEVFEPYVQEFMIAYSITMPLGREKK